MTIKNFEQLNEMHIDILREIGNIGAGNAATSLSQMLMKKVDMAVPEVKLLDINEAIDIMGGPENVVLGILIRMSMDLEGMVMFLLKRDFVCLVVNSLLGTNIERFEDIGEMELSALSEIGNIMIASYINSIASLTGMTIDISVPALTIDMSGAILSVPAIEYANVSDKIVFIQEKFFADKDSVDSHILLVPSVESLNKLLQGLGIEI
ncbi:MAG TPA: chemotaxis protein CheC [Clostridiales bacterium]|nr:chemotaxis protein CheC [Clostridiales bacterium]